MEYKKPISTYVAGSMEFSSIEDMSNWRNEITKKLKHNDLIIYDPVVMESKKSGRDAESQIKRIKNLKQGGKWEQFYNEMWRIWWGDIDHNLDLVQILTHLRMRKHIEGNDESLFKHMGDAEAVIRSNFIIVYVPKEAKMVGTIIEVTLAALFRIPIYLILPDDTKTNANSSLLFANQISNNGKLKSFYNIDDCVNYIKKEYNLN